MNRLFQLQAGAPPVASLRANGRVLVILNPMAARPFVLRLAKRALRTYRHTSGQTYLTHPAYRFSMDPALGFVIT
jgi:hypothetical protein